MISYGYYLHYSYEGIYLYCSWSDLVAQIVARIGSEIGTAFRASFLQKFAVLDFFGACPDDARRRFTRRSSAEHWNHAAHQMTKLRFMS